MEIKKMATSYCTFLDEIGIVKPESKWSRSCSRSRYFQAGIGVGVAEIRRLCSPGYEVVGEYEEESSRLHEFSTFR